MKLFFEDRIQRCEHKFNRGDTAYVIISSFKNGKQGLYAPVTINGVYEPTEQEKRWMGDETQYSYLDRNGHIVQSCPEKFLLTRDELQKELDSGSKLVESKSKKMRDKHIDPYTMEFVDVYKYKGFEIDDTADGFCLFYCGDDLYFPTLDDAEEFIDRELNESLREEFYHFSFTSGSNPYIAWNQREKNRILKKYGDRVREIKPGFYEIDDYKLVDDRFSPEYDDFNESLREGSCVEYITQEVWDNTTSKALSNAFDRDLLSIVRKGDVFYIEGRGCSDREYAIAIKETKRIFPELKYLYDLKQSKVPSLREDAEKKLYCFTTMNNGKKAYLGRWNELTANKKVATPFKKEDADKRLKKMNDNEEGVVWEIEEI